jgi:anaerobic ribonucleoside-triphosphate reductase activating protein
VADVQIALARVQFPIYALGFGRRIGLWVQGCSIGCFGCIVPETWSATREHAVPIDALMHTLTPWLAECDGLTISGGEPCDQADAIALLIDRVRPRLAGDILLYSGYPEAVVRRRHAELLDRVDAAIVEPFRAGLADDRAFIGSANQRCLTLTDLGRVRYEDLSVYRKRIDVAVDPDDGSIRLAGVPHRGDLAALARALTAAGLPSVTTHDAV